MRWGRSGEGRCGQRVARVKACCASTFKPVQRSKECRRRKEWKRGGSILARRDRHRLYAVRSCAVEEMELWLAVVNGRQSVRR